MEGHQAAIRYAAPTDRVIGLSPLQIQRRFTAAARAAGIEARVTAHSGRVGLASELTARGRPRWSTKYNWVSRRAAFVEFTVRECQDATQLGLVQIRRRFIDTANTLLDDGSVPAVRAASRVIVENFPPVPARTAGASNPTPRRNAGADSTP